MIDHERQIKPGRLPHKHGRYHMVAAECERGRIIYAADVAAPGGKGPAGSGNGR
jgi:hypothetical protein